MREKWRLDRGSYNPAPRVSRVIVFLLIVVVCMIFMYLWPGMTLWLPNYLYGG